MIKDPFGFVPEDDFGFVPDVSQQTATAPGPDDFEGALTADKERKRKEEELVAYQAQLAAAAKADPQNWTIKETQDYFKNNPARDIAEEAQRAAFLDAKKQKLNSMKEETSIQMLRDGLRDPTPQEEKQMRESWEKRKGITRDVMGDFMNEHPLFPVFAATMPAFAAANLAWSQLPRFSKSKSAQKLLSAIPDEEISPLANLNVLGPKSPRERASLVMDALQDLSGLFISGKIEEAASKAVIQNAVKIVGGKLYQSGYGVGRITIPDEALERVAKVTPSGEALLENLRYREFKVAPNLWERPFAGLGTRGEAIIPKLSVGDFVTIGKEAGKILKIEGDKTLVAIGGQALEMALKDLQKSDLLPQEIPEDRLKDVPTEKKQYVKDVYLKTSKDEVIKAIEEDPDYALAVKRNEALPQKEFIDSFEPEAWPEYYGAYLAKYNPDTIKPAQGQPEAVIMVGLPGAQKSSVIKKMGIKDTHVQIDPDDPKKYFIPESVADGALAGHVKDESGFMAETLLASEAMAQGKNIVWPKIGKNPETLMKLFEDLRAAGYKINLVYNKLSTIESIKRAYKRFLEEKRLVDHKYISGVGDLTIQQVYDTIKMKADKYAAYDVNVPFGQPIKEIEKGVGDARPIKAETAAAGPAGPGRAERPLHGPGVSTPGPAQKETTPAAAPKQIATYIEKEGRNLAEWENADLTLPELRKKLQILIEGNDDPDLVQLVRDDILKRRWSWGAEPAAAIPGEPVAFLDADENLENAKAIVSYTEDGEKFYAKIVETDSFVPNKASDRPSILFDTSHDAMVAAQETYDKGLPVVKDEGQLVADSSPEERLKSFQEALKKETVPPEIPPEEETDPFLKEYDTLTEADRAKFDLEMDDLRKTPEGNLFVAIHKLGGVRPYKDKFLKEELQGIPAYLKNKNGQALDEILSELEGYGWHFESSDDLLEAIKNQAANPTPKVNRAALRQIIREAEKNKKLQEEMAAKMGKRRKFITTVKEAEKTAPEVSKKIESRYEPITNKDTLAQAQEFVKNSYDEAVGMVEGPGRASTFSNAVAIVLIDKAQLEKRFEDAIRLVEVTAQKNTELGQAIQALSMYARLTPEGILRYAQKMIKKARGDVSQKQRISNFEKEARGKSPAEIEELAKKYKVPHISEIVAGQLREMAQNIQRMPSIDDWPDFENVPPRWAYQFTLDLFKYKDWPEGMPEDLRRSFQVIFDSFQKFGVTGENVPWSKEEQLAFDEWKKTGKVPEDFIDKNVPWSKELQDSWNIGVGRMNRARQIEIALLLKKIADQIPPGLGKRVSMLQTMAQLLNPKTFIRNILGNVGFMGVENIAETFGAVLDIATSLVTGKRTVTWPMLEVQGKGLVQGLKEGTQEALMGINLRRMGQRFDLPQNGVFDTGVLGALEKSLGVALKATDQAFWQAAYNQSLRQQTLLAGLEEPTPEMIETAALMGWYRTFQDDNVISQLFVRLKKTLNLGKDFGIGDVILKYPKTPGNLLARGIEYSPFGFAKTCYLLTKGLLKKEFDQESFVRSTARAFTGSALLVGAGAVLASLGIITGKRNKDRDVRAAQKEAGLGEYQVNVDALKRFTLSGMDPDQAKLREGDRLVNYDWFLPSSIGLALGANMVLNKDRNIVDRTINMAERVMEASETLAEQPVVRGVKVLTQKEKISEGLADVIKDIPASFVPTLLNQIRQLTDNVARNTRDPNYGTEVLNKVAYRIPGVSGRLPASVTPLGQERQIYQDSSNNPFNVFLNPAFVTKYNPDPVTKMVLEIYETTGETIHFPRVAQARIKLGSDTPEPVELTPAQYTEYQRYIGNKTRVLFDILQGNEKFMVLPDDEKAKKLQGYLTDINTAAKIEILGYRPKRVPRDVISIIKYIHYDVQEIKKTPEPEDDFGFVPERR